MIKKSIPEKKLAKAILTLTNINSDGTRRETLTIETVGKSPIKMTNTPTADSWSRSYEIIFSYAQASILDIADTSEDARSKYHALTTIGSVSRELTLNGLSLQAKGYDLFVLSNKSEIHEMTLLNPHLNILNITEIPYIEVTQ